jgi:hypothetical protein
VLRRPPPRGGDTTRHRGPSGALRWALAVGLAAGGGGAGGRQAGTAGVLIHGRLDLGGPPDTAWQLANAWPDAELHLVRTGHGGGPDMTARILEATDRFARRA